MLIRDIITESYEDELTSAVQDLLSLYMNKGVESIPTEVFRSKMESQGYAMSTEQVIAAVDASGYANSVDAETIVPGNQLPDLESGPDADDPESAEDENTVQQMSDKQDVKSEL
jgi:hypothetical protein